MRRALIIGSNYPGTDYALRGCVPDAHMLAALCREQYGTEATLLLDQQATKAGILEATHAMFSATQPGDHCFWAMSSHGTQVRDRNGDEPDRLDEALVPFDSLEDESKLLTDDEIAALVTLLPAGARLTMSVDACHSGTLLRGDPLRRPRSLPIDIEAEKPATYGWRSWAGLQPKPRVFGTRIHTKGEGDVVLLSATTARQTAADAHIDGGFHGAHTYALNVVVRAYPAASLRAIRVSMYHWLKQNGFGGHDGQTPELQGSALLRRSPFLAA